MSTFAKIEDTAQALNDAKEAYLRRFGWKCTSNIPGSYWLWVRDFSDEDAASHARWKERGPGPMGWPSEPKPYGQITATLDMAINMTRSVLDTHDRDSEGDEERNDG